MDLPRYCLLGPRPVKVLESPDGGLAILKLDMNTGRFVDGLDVGARVLSEKDDVDRLTEAQFITEVECARARMRHSDATLDVTYTLIRTALESAAAEDRGLTPEEATFVAALARQTHARFAELCEG